MPMVDAALITAVVNGVVYTGCRDSNLYALDAATGKERGSFSIGASWVITSPANVGSIFSSPLVVSGVIYLGSADGNLYASTSRHSL
jgi:eukaryotic-like serine/threonine-protein kinase